MITFKSKAQAKAYLDKLVSLGHLETNSRIYWEPGTYTLTHGQYDRPDYEPAKYKNGWGIAANRYWYKGTIGAPSPRGRVDLKIVSYDYGDELHTRPWAA